MLMAWLMRRRAIPVLLGLVAAVAYPAEQVQPEPTQEEEPLLSSFETAHWSPGQGTPGFAKGAQKASLGFDAVSGGETYYARFPAGSHFELHWHTHTEYATVLRGQVTLTLGVERYSLAQGSYVIIPAKMHHEWRIDAGDDLFLLVRRAGPADFNFVDR